MQTRPAVIIGVFLLLAAGLHAGVSAMRSPPGPRPLHIGSVSGGITYRIDAARTGVHQADGCRVELYDTFILVYIDKQKAPAWGKDSVVPIQWRDIVDMTLLPE